MASTTQGESGYLFGVDATSATDTLFQNLRRGRSDALVTEIKNETGQRITKRSDDETKALSGELRIKTGFTEPGINTKFTITGGKFAGDYFIVSIDNGQTNDGFVTFQFNAEAWEYIVPA
jgi:hypothetical protein